MTASRPAGLEVLVIGAGFSGVCAGIKLLERGITNFRIIDKGSGIGGTWWENTYPGAACDVPAHLYSFSFEPNPNWSRLYAPQVEIQEYIEHCADKYGLRPYLRLETGIQSLTFDQQTAMWVAGLDDGTNVSARHVINGSGGLHKPSIPQFPGLDAFRGASMHTAQWDHDFDFAGKRVAVIGTAASAIQVIPQLAKVAAHVDVFQRTPSYVAPRNDFAYSEQQKRRFGRFPWLRKLYRLGIFMRMELTLYPIIMKEKLRRKKADLVRGYMRSQVRDRDLAERLNPQYEMGCKRILISDDFYETLRQDHVSLVTEGIDHVTETGIVTPDGAEHAVDAIVFATGFDIQGHLLSIEVTGRDGLTLADAWAEVATAHRGVMIPGFPNYYMTTGPNTGVGTTSVVFMVETTLKWILDCMEKADRDKIVAPKPEAHRAYNDRIQAALGDTVWATGCESWYKRPDGVIETLYPYNARSFRRAMRRVRARELEIDPAPPFVPAADGAEVLT